MADPYLSQITAYGCNYAIRDWALCQGQIVQISQYAALFALLGTNFGGNGTTTFGLPNLQGRAPLGMGTLLGGGYYPLGQTSGFEAVPIYPSNLPPQSLTVTASGTTTETTTTIDASDNGPDTADPQGAFQGTFPPSTPVYASALTTPPKSFGQVKIPAQSVSVSGTTSPMGNGAWLENRSPYQVVNWQISLDGLFPPRN